ncbi:type IV pilus modification PilV family protein [Azohydromonas sediminis]|uniref:type IV pilus modification PilV family protein n=1 Tax=Azohydromonas sediminis TaxID=2259674 RepID=UPI000E65D649|nr:pilus assembly protein PilV [Azohydromonas sediminis]
MARQRQLGISLVEALVALAVMAFGLVAYVGVQSALRANGDIARQRAEATRIAQEAIESWRAFTAMHADPDHPEFVTYDSVATQPSDTVEGLNATYTVARFVLDDAPLNAKTLVVEVDWRDRNDEPQRVRLATAIAAVPPELAGTLSVRGAGNPGRLPAGRHPAIPLDAVPIEGGRSRLQFEQPDGGTVALVFNDLTGAITTVCSPASVCTAVDALLLAGHVRYATTTTAPTAADAEAPPSPVDPLVGVTLQRTAPSARTVTCFVQRRTTDLRYLCAVPVATEGDGALRWSGRSQLTGLPLAVDRDDASAAHYRVCRYTTQRSHEALPNDQHPLDYTDVTVPLANQNFLVIRAGDGTLAFDCPDDDPATEFVNGRTWHHQPPN